MRHLELDNRALTDLSLQPGPLIDPIAARVLVVGEVLWDHFPDATRLGGAALNFAAHLKRLRHTPLLVSAVGADRLGDDARSAIGALGLDMSFVQSTDRFKTGSALVRLGPDEQTSFTIERPAAYDAVDLSDAHLQQIVHWRPSWLYYGTLFPSAVQGRGVLHRLLDALPHAARFYDLNLRPGFEAPELVEELLRSADVVKLNERELLFAYEYLNLPADPERFCAAGARRYGWQAACITLGAGGCALRVGDDYTEAAGCAVAVADPVGAGDAFAAALLHGVVSNWPVATIASFANRVGALVAGRPGAIPDWTAEDVRHP